MDGPAMSGRQIVGGVSVEITGNLSPLRQSIAQARQLASGLEGKPIAMTFMADTAQIDASAKSMRYLVAAAKSMRHIKQEPVVLDVKLDRQAITQQFAEMILGLRRVAASMPINLSVGFNQSAGGVGRGSLGGASSTFSSGGEHGAGHSDMSRRNLLSLRGLEASGVVGSATAAYGIIEAVHLAGELSKAMEINSHPEKYIRQRMGFNETRDLINDPVMQATSSRQASADAGSSMMKSLEGVPLLGSLAQLADSATGLSRRFEEESEAAKKSADAHMAVMDALQSQAVYFAGVSGGSPAAFLQQATGPNSQLAKLKQEAAKYGPAGSELSISAPMRLFGVDAQTAEMKKTLEAFAAEGKIARKAASQEEERVNHEYHRAKNIDQEAINGISEGGSASRYRAESARARQSGDYARAAQLDHMASRTTREAAFANEVASAPETHTAALRDAHKEETAAIEADRQERASQVIASSTAEAVAKQKQVLHDGFAAELIEYDSATKQKLSALKDATPQEVAAVAQSRKLIRQAMNDQHAEEVADANRGFGAKAQSAVYQSRKMGFEDSLINFRANMKTQLEHAKPEERAAMTTMFSAQLKGMVVQHKREIESEGIGYMGRKMTAEAQLADHPMDARASQFLTSTASEILNASPEQLGHVLGARRKELAAMRHETLDMHSGGYALAFGAHEFAGNPLDMQRMAEDRRSAKGKLDQADKAIKDAEKGQKGDNDPGKIAKEQAGLLKDISDFLKQINDKMSPYAMMN